MIRCVLFDLDGTLVDTWDLYVEAYIRALEPFVGRRLSLEELIRLRPNSELRLLRRALPGTDIQVTHREFLRQYWSLHRTHFGGVYPGTLELLGTLRARRFRVGIVTGKSRGAWEITAAMVNLGPFDLVVGDEDVVEGKPDPAGLVLALDRLGIPAGQAIYVGDSVIDAKAARAAGVRFAAALWPKAETELGEFLPLIREVGVRAELPEPGSLIEALEKHSG
jgi:phosphoglycolate phosphatase-like HAD superfamily hydrolase